MAKSSHRRSPAHQGHPWKRVRHARRGPWLQLFHPTGFEWTVAEVQVPGLSPALDGLKILHLTDLHLRSRWSAALDDLRQRIMAARADLLVITGDFVHDRHDYRPAIPLVRRLLDGLAARLGMFAILGNHDGDLMAPRLARKLTLLNGRRACLHNHEAGIEVIGLPGAFRRDTTEEFVSSVPPRRPGTLRIVLSHFPDLVRRTQAMAPDLVFAGHTHGGQVCLPGRIPIIRHDALPRRYASGIHWIHGTWLVVGRGMGFSLLPVRVFCPAEVVEVTLRR